MAKLLTYSEIEKIYGLKKNTTTKLFMKGEFIPTIKIGNRNYFNAELLDAWLVSRTVGV